jgi:hypothetical protein
MSQKVCKFIDSAVEDYNYCNFISVEYNLKLETVLIGSENAKHFPVLVKQQLFYCFGRYAKMNHYFS